MILADLIKIHWAFLKSLFAYRQTDIHGDDIIAFFKFSFRIIRAAITFQILYNVSSQLSTPPFLTHRLRSERYDEIRILRKSELNVHKVKRIRWIYRREFTWSPRFLKTGTRPAATWQLYRQWHRPAVSSLHLRLTALSFSHEKIRGP